MFGPAGQRYLDEMPFTGTYAIQIASLRDLLEIYERELVDIERAVARRLRGHTGYRAIRHGVLLEALLCAARLPPDHRGCHLRLRGGLGFLRRGLQGRHL
jgi:hypothetical protein